MSDDVELARENWEHYVYARDHGHLDYTSKATLCEQYFYGEHWAQALKQKLLAQGKPVLTINKVFSSLITIMGEQLQNRAGISFLPVDDVADPETAEVLDKLYMHILRNNGMEHKEAAMFDEAVITSRGWLDCRMDFSNNLRGEVKISLLNGKNVVIDPDASSYDPDDWNECFTTKWFSPMDISHKYGSAAAKELKLKARSDFEYGIDSVDSLSNTFAGGQFTRSGVSMGYGDNQQRRFIRVLERQYKTIVRKEHFVDMQTGDMRVIPDSWDHNRIVEVASKYGLGVFNKDIPMIKWLVTADNIVLHNKISPYKHFTPVPYFPIFHKGRTIGMVENLISPQDYLNKTTSQELHVVNTTANSGWQMEEDQLVNMDDDELEQRGAETGLVLVRKKGSLPLEKINPNQVPTGLDRIAYKADEFVKDLSGVSDSSRGFDRADVAAKAIMAKQAVGGITNAKMLSNLAFSRKLLARNILDLVQEFYTESRIIRVTGQTQNKTQSIAINQMQADGTVLNDLTIGTYDIIIADVPARDRSEDTQFSEAIQMRKEGIAIPDHVIVEVSHMTNRKEIADEIKAQQGQGPQSQNDQRVAQLDMQLKELAVQQAQVAIKQKAADAKYTEARAFKAAGEAKDKLNGSNNGGGGQDAVDAANAQIALAKVKGELALEREKIMGELALEREKMAGELRLKQDIARADSVIKRATAAQANDNKTVKDSTISAKSGT